MSCNIAHFYTCRAIKKVLSYNIFGTIYSKNKQERAIFFLFHG